MIKYIIINSIVVYLAAALLPKVYIKSYFTALGVAILLGLINTFIKPILIFISLPVTILTLGLFIIVINAFILVMVDKLVDGLKIEGFGQAIIMSLLMGVLNWILYAIF